MPHYCSMDDGWPKKRCKVTRKKLGGYKCRHWLLGIDQNGCGAGMWKVKCADGDSVYMKIYKSDPNDVKAYTALNANHPIKECKDCGEKSEEINGVLACGGSSSYRNHPSVEMANCSAPTCTKQLECDGCPDNTALKEPIK